MRRLLAEAVPWLLLLGLPALAEAGIYIHSEPPVVPPFDNYDKFEEGRVLLIRLAIPAEEQEKTLGAKDPRVVEIQTKYLQKIADLERAQQEGTLTVEDRVNLSGYYLRLYNPAKRNPDRIEQAIKVLTSDGRMPFGYDPNNNQSADSFLLSNLATAISLREVPPQDEQNKLDEAIDNLEAAIQAWPNVSIHYNQGELQWFLHAEYLQLRMLKARQREARLDQAARNAGRPPKPQDRQLDDVFPVLRKIWLSRDGYAAGMLSPRNLMGGGNRQDEIPANAVDLVAQMVYWYPHDRRIYWLLAEMLNAVHGNFIAAYMIVDGLNRGQYETNELMEHRKILLHARQSRDSLVNERERVMREQLRLSLGIPTGNEKNPQVAPYLTVPLPLGTVPTMSALALAVAVNEVNNDPGDRSAAIPPPSAPTSPTKESAAPGLKLDWKQIIVSFVAGALLSLLIVQQWREYRHRREQQEANRRGIAQAERK